MHPAKRRRLDESNATLSKPFRSPLRVDVKSQKRHVNHPEQVVHTRPANVIDHEITTTTPLPSTTHPPSPPNNSSPTRERSSLLSSSPCAPTKDPEYIPFQKTHSALTLQLSQLRQSLDTAQQAVKIQSFNTDAELAVLISKWKLVSREAAEEIFCSARDRVSRMGGVGVWHKRNNSKESHRGWDDQEEEPINEDNLTDEQKVLREEQRDMIEEQREALQAERMKYGTGPEEEVVTRDDDSFTMDMMLESLKVDLELIGYDKESQRWVD